MPIREVQPLKFGKSLCVLASLSVCGSCSGERASTEAVVVPAASVHSSREAEKGTLDPPVPQGIACGDSHCPPKHVCCRENETFSCSEPEKCISDDGRVPFDCTRSSDCEKGDYCCVFTPTGSRCGDECNWGHDSYACETDEDCGGVMMPKCIAFDFLPRGMKMCGSPR
jgi:hypothetical protein